MRVMHMTTGILQQPCQHQPRSMVSMPTSPSSSFALNRDSDIPRKLLVRVETQSSVLNRDVHTLFIQRAFQSRSSFRDLVICFAFDLCVHVVL